MARSVRKLGGNMVSVGRLALVAVGMSAVVWTILGCKASAEAPLSRDDGPQYVVPPGQSVEMRMEPRADARAVTNLAPGTMLWSDGPVFIVAETRWLTLRDGYDRRGFVRADGLQSTGDLAELSPEPLTSPSPPMLQGPAASAFDEEIAPNGQPMRAGSLVMRFRPDVPFADKLLVYRAEGVLEVEPLLLPDTVRVTVPRGTTATALASVAGRPEVQWVEPDYAAGAGGAGVGAPSISP